MRKLSGDGLAFINVYQRCSEYMNAYINSPESVRDALQFQGFSFLEAPSQSLPEADTCLAPVMDLAAMEDENLKAEAMAALCHMVREADVALQLCTPQAFLLFQSLLHVVCFSVAQPLAQLLQSLARWQEAAQYFAQQAFLQAMIDKVMETRFESQPTAEHLAEALRLAISNCAVTLPNQAKQELAMSLSRALACSSLADRHDTMIVDNLQESLQRLTLAH
jgi:hypothetical protein